MPREHVTEDRPVQAEDHARTLEVQQRQADVLDRAGQFGPHLTSRQAMQYIPCPTLNAFYQWCRRHGVRRSVDGTIPRERIDRIKGKPRKVRIMAPASLANLRKRSA